MKSHVAAFAAILAAGPAMAQPIIIELERKPAEQPPQPSPVPVAPPQAEANQAFQGQPSPAPAPGTAQAGTEAAPGRDAVPQAQPTLR